MRFSSIALMLSGVLPSKANGENVAELEGTSSLQAAPEVSSMDDLTQEQQEILDKFRVCVSDICQPNHDDHFLLRWLRARDFSVEKAEFMLRESMNVRRQMKLDTLVETYKVPEVLSKYYPGGHFGFDREGTPVFIDPIGQIDFRGLLASVKKNEIIRFKAYLAEYTLFLSRQQSSKLGKHIDQVVMVMDMEGLGLKHLWRPGVTLFNKITAFYEDNYPEMMKNILVINAPRIFPIAYALVKPFLNEVTRNKVKILRDWKTELLEYIDEDNLPEYYGGTCKDPDGDPLCRSKICYGGDVPESYYCKDCDKPDTWTDEQMYEVGCVKRGTALKLSFEVDAPGSILSWQYKSVDHDIGFGVFYSEKGSKHSKDLEEKIPTERRNCHLVQEEGSLLCEKPGIYILRFDNSYSWTRNKKIFYNVTIVYPLKDSNGHVDVS